MSSTASDKDILSMPFRISSNPVLPYSSTQVCISIIDCMPRYVCVQLGSICVCAEPHSAINIVKMDSQDAQPGNSPALFISADTPFGPVSSQQVRCRLVNASNYRVCRRRTFRYESTICGTPPPLVRRSGMASPEPWVQAKTLNQRRLDQLNDDDLNSQIDLAIYLGRCRRYGCGRPAVLPSESSACS